MNFNLTNNLPALDSSYFSPGSAFKLGDTHRDTGELYTDRPTEKHAYREGETYVNRRRDITLLFYRLLSYKNTKDVCRAVKTIDRFLEG